MPPVVVCSIVAAAAAAKSLQSCPTLCDPVDGSPLALPRPWGSPGKNTGVGCHCLLWFNNYPSLHSCLKTPGGNAS